MASVDWGLDEKGGMGGEAVGVDSASHSWCGCGQPGEAKETSAPPCWDYATDHRRQKGKGSRVSKSKFFTLQEKTKDQTEEAGSQSHMMKNQVSRSQGSFPW